MELTFRKKIGPHLLLGLCMLPLFFIHVDNKQGWGDDFAGYINQAKALVQGVPQDQYGYIYNPNSPLYAPVAYPTGYPLILAPFVYYFGISLKVFKIVNTLILFLIGYVSFYFFAKKWGKVEAFALTLSLLYNPWILDFKWMILSEFAFTFFLFLSVALLYHKRDQFVWVIVSALCCGYAMSIKSTGIAMVLAYLMFGVETSFRTKSWREFYRPTAFALTAIGLYLFMNRLLFPIRSEVYSHFSTIYFAKGFSWSDFGNNIFCYRDLMKQFFTFSNGWENFFAIVTSYVMTYGVLFSLVYRLWRKRTVIDYMVLLFLASVILFPVCNQGFRYMFPITFFIVYMVMDMFENKLLYLRRFLVAFILITTLVGCIHYVGQQTKNQHYIQASEQGLFDFIKANTHSTDTFVFMHPRALVLNIGRYALPEGDDKESSLRTINLFNPHYAIFKTSEKHKYVDTTRCVFRNERYVMYGLR